jgi:antagonist of KipI
LRKGDVLRIGPASASFRKQSLASRALEQLPPRKALRATPGPQFDSFPGAAQQLFFESTYRVAEESNRMGLRLEGPSITQRSAGEMITEGVSLGAVQITAAGLPIILFVEQQTTGGYAKIANVISADLHSLGQLRPRDDIHFEHVDWDTARALLLEQEQLLTSPDLFVL